jgi:hypothetical protein
MLTGHGSVLLEQASRILGNHSHFAPEIARVNFKKWKVLQKLGRAAEAELCSREALKIHRSIHANDKRSLEEMTDDDFDKDIMFWSR